MKIFENNDINMIEKPTLKSGFGEKFLFEINKKISEFNLNMNVKRLEKFDDI